MTLGASVTDVLTARMLTSPSTRRRGETTRAIDIGARQMTVAIGIAGPRARGRERQRQARRAARHRLGRRARTPSGCLRPCAAAAARS